MGKANTGKSTFFNAATLLNVPMASYPFTTVSPNKGVATIRVSCMCKKLNIDDNPINSSCIEGNRFIPVQLIDVAGLVPHASEGKGLGNKFLDELRQSDVIIQVVDSSGSSDANGNPCDLGDRDPLNDISFVESEFNLWLKQIILRDWTKLTKILESGTISIEQMLVERLSGLAITDEQIHEAIRKSDLKGKLPNLWTDSNLLTLASNLRSISKPSIIAANKSDLSSSKSNINRIKEDNRIVIPCAAEAELLLRRAATQGLINYLPGDDHFNIISPSNLTSDQSKALRFVEDKILSEWSSTGVQEAINSSYLDLLNCIVVYPVEDEHTFSDKKGNVLPDSYVLKKGSTTKDLAGLIHSDLKKNFLYAIDAKKGIQLSSDHILEDSDIIRIISASRKN